MTAFRLLQAKRPRLRWPNCNWHRLPLPMTAHPATAGGRKVVLREQGVRQHRARLHQRLPSRHARLLKPFHLRPRPRHPPRREPLRRQRSRHGLR